MPRTPRPGDFDWTDDSVTELRMRWHRGDSTTKISCDMGVSRGGLIGMAHHLDLPTRPRTPVEPATVEEPKIRCGSRHTLPQVAETAPAPAPLLLDTGRSGVCNWPLWPHDARRPTHEYCGAPRVRGPYCAEHAALSVSGAAPSLRWAAKL
jgi:hypothetical protein